MTERHLRQLWAWAAAGGLAAVAAARLWSPQLAAGVLAGSAWNLANLWCLIHLLNAWIGPSPSRRRVIGWLIPKLLLYGAAFAVLQGGAVSLGGFAVGFSVVLLLLVGGYAAMLQRRIRAS
jgi:hypothetical protein